MSKKLHIKILVLLFLIISNYTIGQSTLNVANGGKIYISSGTTVQNQNLDIGSGSQLVNRGDLTVNGVLANDAGTPGLILKADQNGYGSLLHNTADVPGSMEQYLTSERWHLVSSPMANATIETYIDIYLKQWNETDSTWTYLVQPLSMPLNATTGYSAWVSDALTGPTTVNYEGNLNNGDYNVSLAYTPTSNATGWNLIGNPYPSTIEWNLDTSWNRTNVGGWIVVYDNATFKGWNPFLSGNDRSYNGKTDGIIPATQGFWVRAFASPANLILPQSLRTHNSQIFYKDAEKSNYKSLRLKAIANNYEDEAVIIFMEGATKGFDGLYDLEKLYNVDEAPNIYSGAEGNISYSVNVLPHDFISTTDTPIIPVGFKLGLEKECTITVSGIEGFDPYTPIYLEDLKEGEMINLRYQNSYNYFTHPLDNPNRFLLHFGEPNIIEEEIYSEVSIYSYENQVYVKIPASSKGEAEVFDMLGKKVSSFKLHQELTREPIYKTGYYIVKVKTSENFTTNKVFIKN